jgi:chorismate mutase
MTLSRRNLREEVERAILETSRREGIRLSKATLRLLEERLVALGMLAGRLVAIAHSPRDDGTRINRILRVVMESQPPARSAHR